MNKRGVGVSFCGLAAFLYASYYLTAAIWGSNMSSWDAETFNHLLSYIGPSLKNYSMVCLCIGIFYLVWAEWSEHSNKPKW